MCTSPVACRAGPATSRPRNKAHPCAIARRTGFLCTCGFGAVCLQILNRKQLIATQNRRHCRLIPCRFMRGCVMPVTSSREILSHDHVYFSGAPSIEAGAPIANRLSIVIPAGWTAHLCRRAQPAESPRLKSQHGALHGFIDAFFGNVMNSGGISGSHLILWGHPGGSASTFGRGQSESRTIWLNPPLPERELPPSI